jgi:pyruvate, orthophosphate dikinase
MSFLYSPIERIAQFVTMPAKSKYIYSLHEGSRDDFSFLSSKGANLCEVSRLGFSVPRAFIISSEAAEKYLKQNSRTLDSNIQADIRLAIGKLEEQTGHLFGATSDKFPLLLTVRGGSTAPTETIVGAEETDLSFDTVNHEVMDVLGAPDSWCIPGLKESCLGIGLNDDVVRYLATLTSKFYAYNAYAHFLIRFGTIVLNIPKSKYRSILSEFVEKTGKSGDQMTEDDVYYIYQRFKEITDLPQDPYLQLEKCVSAMYNAWYDYDSVLYRQEAFRVHSEKGIAVIVQMLIMGDTGIAFTRNPISGEHSTGSGLFGCIWTKQGVKKPIQEYYDQQEQLELIYQLQRIAKALEHHYADMMQMEFVVTESTPSTSVTTTVDASNTTSSTLPQVHLLQVFPGRRTPYASVRIAVEMHREQLISEREAILRVHAQDPHVFIQYRVDALREEDIIAIAQTASRGIVCGVLAFTGIECLQQKAKGNEVIFVQSDPDSVDQRALTTCSGLILLRGSVLSPPAALCRALGKPCITMVSGMKLLSPDPANNLMLQEYQLEIKEQVYLKTGDCITLNASNGRVYQTCCPTVNLFEIDEYHQSIIQWCEQFRTMKVKAKLWQGHYVEEMSQLTTSSTSTSIAAPGLKSLTSVDGYGCIETNHLFTCTEDRLHLMRMTLIAKTVEQKREHLEALCQLLQNDFEEIIMEIISQQQSQSSTSNKEEMELPFMAFKLLDLPLSIFLQTDDVQNVSAFATRVNLCVSEVKDAFTQFHDPNPEFGLRGCRITTLYPEITEMQLTALFQACWKCIDQYKIRKHPLKPHIWIPTITSAQELRNVIDTISMIHRMVCQHMETVMSMSMDDISEESVSLVQYTVGVIFDTPRACLRADTLAQHVHAFAIDLNRLTSHIYSCSKDDAKRLFSKYILQGIYKVN